MDVDAEGDRSLRDSVLDYLLEFSVDGIGWVAGTVEEVFIDGWTFNSAAEDWVARWLSPVDAHFVRISKLITNGHDGNTQIDAIIAATAFPDGKIEIRSIHVSGETAVIEFVARGTHEGELMGIAPTGNIDPERRYPSMFEPIHGSAFDIMGKGLANPVGTFWSVVMLLEHLGEPAAARRVMLAIEAVTANPALHTRDLGGSATTAQVTQAVCDFLAAEQAQAA